MILMSQLIDTEETFSGNIFKITQVANDLCDILEMSEPVSYWIWWMRWRVYTTDPLNLWTVSDPTSLLPGKTFLIM